MKKIFKFEENEFNINNDNNNEKLNILTINSRRNIIFCDDITKESNVKNNDFNFDIFIQ
jgi:hypothetical protein